MDRRQFLQAALAAAAATSLAGAQGPPTFLELSTRLTGFPDLDPAFARRLEAALAGRIDEAAVVEAWYTGIVPGEDQVTLPAPLAWRSVGRPGPPGRCL